MKSQQNEPHGRPNACPDDVRSERDDHRRAGHGGDTHTPFESMLESLARQQGSQLFERIVRDVSAWVDDGKRSRVVGEPEYQDNAGHGRVDDDSYADESDNPSSMRGRGPKNYRRTEQHLLERVVDALQDDPQLDATDVDVSLSAGDVVLAGSVSSRKDKHRAENLAARATSLPDVDNRLRVRPTPSARRTYESSDEISPGGTPGEQPRDEDRQPT